MPDTNRLVFEIDSNSLAPLLASARNVVVGKQSATGLLNVAWLAWQPAVRTTLTWSDTYGLFAAPGSLPDEAVLQIATIVATIEERMIYPFYGNRFGTPEWDFRLPARHFDVRNDSSAAATFGLLQCVSVDDVPICAPVNAAVVPVGFTADFTALTTLRVWLQSRVTSGSIISLPSRSTVVACAGGPRTNNYRYCPSNDLFVANSDAL